MDFDLVIRNGRVLDPAQGIDGPRTIGIKDGRVKYLAVGAPSGDAHEIIDASGSYVVPGLIDFHTHCYWGGTPLGVNADKIGPATGVTGWVDTGSAGPGNFPGFYHHVIERSRVRIFPFLHISHIGLVHADGLYLSLGELFDFRLLNFHELLRVGDAYRDRISGIKVRLSINATGPHSADALRFAREAATALQTRLMVHVGPPPPFIDDVLRYLEAGDILTHCFTPYHGGIVDHELRIRDSVWRARERGVLFDVGHGSTSFAFEVARAAMDQGFPPDFISSDIHSKNVNGPVHNMPTTMAKFLALGMPLDQVIARTTEYPAKALDRADLGGLFVGEVADIAILDVEDAPQSFEDVQKKKIEGSQRLSARQTIVAGEVVVPIDDGREEGSGSGPVPAPRAPTGQPLAQA